MARAKQQLRSFFINFDASNIKTSNNRENLIHILERFPFFFSFPNLKNIDWHKYLKHSQIYFRSNCFGINYEPHSFVWAWVSLRRKFFSLCFERYFGECYSCPVKYWERLYVFLCAAHLESRWIYAEYAACIKTTLARPLVAVPSVTDLNLVERKCITWWANIKFLTSSTSIHL